ncbi:MAG: type II toxin-antitoxin system HicB family antitoxin [Pseudomonadota bacterium]
MSVYVFPAIVHKEGETYGLVFPDLPGCVTVADTQRELAINASEALSGSLEVMLDHEDRIPEPTALEDLTLKADEGDVAAILVTAYAVKSKEVA